MMINKQIQQARKADIVKYLTAKGLQDNLKKEGKNYRFKGYSGLLIRDNYFYCHSTKDTGNAIDFLMKYLNLDFKTAVSELTSTNFEVAATAEPLPTNTPTTLEMPVKNPNMRRVYAYLCKTRKLSPDVVNLATKAGLYQDDKGNCVFPKRITGKITGAEVIGTLDRVRFKKYIGEGTWTLGNENSDTIIIFESPIDALSFIELYKCEKNALTASLTGLKEQPLVNILDSLFKTSKGHLKLIFALDNDKAGQAAAEYFAGKYGGKILKPKNKDWNDDLKKQKE